MIRRISKICCMRCVLVSIATISLWCEFSPDVSVPERSVATALHPRGILVPVVNMRTRGPSLCFYKLLLCHCWTSPPSIEFKDNKNNKKQLKKSNAWHSHSVYDIHYIQCLLPLFGWATQPLSTCCVSFSPIEDDASRSLCSCWMLQR